MRRGRVAVAGESSAARGNPDPVAKRVRRAVTRAGKPQKFQAASPHGAEKSDLFLTTHSRCADGDWKDNK